jgi:HEPN domain-containing protein
MSAPQIEARRWFREAGADLEVVRTLRAGGHYAAACFHSQQSAEKALKAVLYSQGSRLVLEHSVRDLARQCESYDSAFAEMAEGAALLDQLYIPTRYPNGLPSPAVPSETYTAAQAETAQAAAERVLALVENFLRTRTNALK